MQGSKGLSQAASEVRPAFQRRIVPSFPCNRPHQSETYTVPLEVGAKMAADFGIWPPPLRGVSSAPYAPAIDRKAEITTRMAWSPVELSLSTYNSRCVVQVSTTLNSHPCIKGFLRGSYLFSEASLRGCRPFFKACLRLFRGFLIR